MNGGRMPGLRPSAESAGGRVLVAVRDTTYGASLATCVTRDGNRVERRHDLQGMLRQPGLGGFDVVVLDLALGAGSDVNLVSFIRRNMPRGKLILLFDMAHMEQALEGLRNGAFFYLPSSAPVSDVALAVRKAFETLRHEEAARRDEASAVEDLAGGSPAMRRILEQAAKVAPTDSTVLLLGETGTGKEVLAHTVHRMSARSERPMVAINCAALPEALLESEMFGHVKGAFTGATSDKRGLFEEADGGTIFLDEIGDMALVTQAKLLRVLQSGEIRRVGASTSVRVDVRVIAATNRDLEDAVAAKTFREDLYFRLNVIQLRIPPLRERMETLAGLVRYFVSRANARYGRQITTMDDEAKLLLGGYRYPGNIRELESILTHAVIMCDGDTIRACDLPEQVAAARPTRLALPGPETRLEFATLAEMEKRLIHDTLERLHGNQTEAARRLGVSRSTLWRKMRRMGLG